MAQSMGEYIGQVAPRSSGPVRPTQARPDGNLILYQSNSAISAAVAVGKATIRGVSTVWDGMSEAGSLLLTGAQTASVAVTQKKYGEEAATLVSDGFDVGKDVYKVGVNVKSIGIKAIAKTVGMRSQQCTGFLPNEVALQS